jgi:hypothetical protein
VIFVSLMFVKLGKTPLDWAEELQYFSVQECLNAGTAKRRSTAHAFKISIGGGSLKDSTDGNTAQNANLDEDDEV